MEIVQCPECDLPAEVLGRHVMDSTDGPVEHIKILCLNKHWFFLPVSKLPGT